MIDVINNPGHYKGNLGIETKDIIKNNMSKEAYKGYLEGNIIKYITRYKKKNGVEDLKKAKKYIDFLIEELEPVTVGKEIASMEKAITNIKEENEKALEEAYKNLGMRRISF